MNIINEYYKSLKKFAFNNADTIPIVFAAFTLAYELRYLRKTRTPFTFVNYLPVVLGPSLSYIVAKLLLEREETEEKIEIGDPRDLKPLRVI
jgi:hypothetical protein